MLSLGLGLLFISYLFLTVVFRSNERRGVLSLGIVGAADSQSSKGSGSLIGAEAKLGDPAQLRLQDFHRVVMKAGKPAWEVRAVEARYYKSSGVTHVNDAQVTVYRKDETPIELSSNAAKLYLKAETLAGADLEGDIRVKLDQSTVVRSEFASYDAEGRKIVAPGEVLIEGEKFAIEGKRLDYEIDNNRLSLNEDVRSRFSE